MAISKISMVRTVNLGKEDGTKELLMEVSRMLIWTRSSSNRGMGKNEDLTRPSQERNQPTLLPFKKPRPFTRNL
jgi:hypothetical protein